MFNLDYLEEIHGSDPDAAIIWLHGLGASGHDFLPVVSQLNLPDEPAIDFIFPHAPVQPVTINRGTAMPAWYDIHQLDLHAQEDQAGIDCAMHSLEALIIRKCSHLDPKRILLSGFSQGGAVVLHTLLHGTVPIGAVAALSAYLPLRNMAAEAHKERILNSEIFMAHGRYDEVLPHQFGELSRQILLALGASIEWHSYPVAHQLCDRQMTDLRAWIIKKLARR